MNTPKQAGTFQSAVCVIILSVLGFLGLAVVALRLTGPDEPFGTHLQAAAGQTRPAGPLFTPPAGFEVRAGPERYGADTLYEKINGKADLYVSAGFVQLQTWRFAGAAGPWLELFLYEMSNETAAFSVFSTQRRPDAEALDPGAQTCPDTGNGASGRPAAGAGGPRAAAVRRHDTRQ
jgi:hypothetical protein